MGWQDELVPILRALISDFADEPVYSDARLEQLIVVSARFVEQEIDFDVNYTINVSACTISPDPTTATTPDKDAFSNFIVLKAACMADWSTYRSKALLSGIKARCGPAWLETMDHVKGFRDLIDFGPCKAYDTLKKDYKFGNVQVIKAILSPFVSNNFHPQSLSPGPFHHNHNDRIF